MPDLNSTDTIVKLKVLRDRVVLYNPKAKTLLEFIDDLLVKVDSLDYSGMEEEDIEILNSINNIVKDT